MSWKEIFKDENTYNEKSIVGFIAFLMMVIVMLADLISKDVDEDTWDDIQFNTHEFKNIIGR